MSILPSREGDRQLRPRRESRKAAMRSTRDSVASPRRAKRGFGEKRHIDSVTCLDMAIVISMLRGVNLGKYKRLKMEALRELYESLGLRDVQSYLQSGNIVFRSKSTSTAALEKLLEGEAKKRLGLETTFFIRSTAEWHALIAGNPFPREAKSDPARLVALVLKESPHAAAVKALVAAVRGKESVRVNGNVAYIVYPDGQGTSKLTNTVIESKLGTRGTARNWNTVLKLAALAAPGKEEA